MGDVATPPSGGSTSSSPPQRKPPPPMEPGLPLDDAATAAPAPSSASHQPQPLPPPSSSSFYAVQIPHLSSAPTTTTTTTTTYPTTFVDYPHDDDDLVPSAVTTSMKFPAATATATAAGVGAPPHAQPTSTTTTTTTSGPKRAALLSARSRLKSIGSTVKRLSGVPSLRRRSMDATNEPEFSALALHAGQASTWADRRQPTPATSSFSSTTASSRNSHALAMMQHAPPLARPAAHSHHTAAPTPTDVGGLPPLVPGSPRSSAVALPSLAFDERETTRERDRRASDEEVANASASDPETAMVAKVRALAHELASAMDHVEALQLYAEAHARRVRRMDSAGTMSTTSDDAAALRAENESLKAFCRHIKGVVAEHAPHLLPENFDALVGGVAPHLPPPSSSTSPTLGPQAVPISSSSSSAAYKHPATSSTTTRHTPPHSGSESTPPQPKRSNAPTSGGNGGGGAPPPETPSPTGLGTIPFDADSPMLRERMDAYEARLDELRQSLKQCIKSGSTYLGTSGHHMEAGFAFADDLMRSPSPALQRLGKFLSEKLEARTRVLEALDTYVIVPLTKFANDDLKGANHARVELERRREVFEKLEAKLMAHARRDTKRAAAAAAGTPMSMSDHYSGSVASSTTGGGFGGGGGNGAGGVMGGSTSSLTESPDKLLSDLRTAETNFEVARCGLIRALNLLGISQRTVIHQAVGRIAEVATEMIESEAMAAEPFRAFVHDAALNDRRDVRARLEGCEREYAEKRHALDAYRSSPLAPRPFTLRRRDAEPDLVHEGWLMKRSSNVMKDWKKRFFQIRGGALLYYRGNVPTHVADLALCTIKMGGGVSMQMQMQMQMQLQSVASSTGEGSSSMATSDDHAFEVISNKRSMALQAFSEEEKDAWVSALRRTIEAELQRGFVPSSMGPASSSLGASSTSSSLVAAPSLLSLSAAPAPAPAPVASSSVPFQLDWTLAPAHAFATPGPASSAATDGVLPTATTLTLATSEAWTPISPDAMEANRRCADCGAALESRPKWVALNLGVFVCIACSGMHRSLGTHVSKVKSVQLDRLTEPQLEILRRVGNAASNRVWEARADAAAERKRAASTNASDLAAFVRDKYVSRMFVEPHDPALAWDDAVRFAERDDLAGLVQCVAERVSFAAPLVSLSFALSDKGCRTPLHAAAASATAATCEFLLLNGGTLDAVDEEGRTPLDVARAARNAAAEAVLGGSSSFPSSSSSSTSVVVVAPSSLTMATTTTSTNATMVTPRVVAVEEL